MTNEQVIEQLKQGNWYVECYAYSETYTLLCACDDAGIKWRTSVKATDFIPKALDLLEIGCRTAGKGISCSLQPYCGKNGYENITNWFFDAIKRNEVHA
ncbi:hypothetical protein [Gilliamella apicola]|uniref:Uncharacterized protein n=1 Tax=Gilliamella apicola TaxID=1196095 RepID=A0A242NEV3_9GAMM|nr:hypothetical protein [Gilliamella apicola]OTP82391.1 hypothetical protein B5S40_07015 [Gilliamella apicola]OTP84542.1 hypothetical protein B5S44_09815 [Gilliamella apicola]OTP98351.1 hypothetical protein B6D08_11455 [Gilliamella apicola]OTQ09432.1 hypothetical protein B6C91_09285 [Gilliamella apicola]OTQ13948.1 hypothetical protein B6D11_09415 [Gilliamella apicola]